AAGAGEPASGGSAPSVTSFGRATASSTPVYMLSKAGVSTRGAPRRSPRAELYRRGGPGHAVQAFELFEREIEGGGREPLPELFDRVRSHDGRGDPRTGQHPRDGHGGHRHALATGDLLEDREHRPPLVGEVLGREREPRAGLGQRP